MRPRSTVTVYGGYSLPTMALLTGIAIPGAYRASRDFASDAGVEKCHGFAGARRALETSYGPVNRFLGSSRRLLEMLPADGGQVIRLVVGDVPGRQDEDDLQPLGGQRAERVMMAQVALATAVVVRPRPGAVLKGLERELLDRVAQMQIAREAELHEAAVAAALSDRHGAAVSWRVTERLPPPVGIAEFRVQTRDGGTGGPGQRRRPLSRGHAAEKIGHGGAVRLDGAARGG